MVRRVLSAVLASIASAAMVVIGPSALPVAAAVPANLTTLVNPLIGTQKDGNTFPGAAQPSRFPQRHNVVDAGQRHGQHAEYEYPHGSWRVRPVRAPEYRHPHQTTDAAARIYELRVFGLPSAAR